MITIPAYQTPTIEECFNAGKDAALKGSNEDNCHFKYFSTYETSEAWSKGNKEGLLEKLKKQKV